MPCYCDTTYNTDLLLCVCVCGQLVGFFVFVFVLSKQNFTMKTVCFLPVLLIMMIMMMMTTTMTVITSIDESCFFRASALQYISSACLLFNVLYFYCSMLSVYIASTQRKYISYSLPCRGCYDKQWLRLFTNPFELRSSYACFLQIYVRPITESVSKK